MSAAARPRHLVTSKPRTKREMEGEGGKRRDCGGGSGGEEEASTEKERVGHRGGKNGQRERGSEGEGAKEKEREGRVGFFVFLLDAEEQMHDWYDEKEIRDRREEI